VKTPVNWRKKLKILNRVLALALAFVSFASSAQMTASVESYALQNGVPVAVECNDCSSNQLYNAAIAAGLVGTHYFYDLTLGQITAWQTTREPSGRGGYIYDANQVSVPAAIASAFAILKNGVAKYGRTAMNSTVTINLNSKMPGFPSRDSSAIAYNVADTTALQNDIGDWILTGGVQAFTTPLLTGLAQSAFGLLGTTSTIIFKNDAVSATINVTLKDGSVITFSWTAGSNPKFTGGRDKDNNTIPLTLAQVPGNYLFNNDPGGLAAFEQYLLTLGVPVVNGSDFGPIPSVTVECLPKSGGSTQSTIQAN
jgi:hypothetical protein